MISLWQLSFLFFSQGLPFLNLPHIARSGSCDIKCSLRVWYWEVVRMTEQYFAQSIRLSVELLNFITILMCLWMMSCDTCSVTNVHVHSCYVQRTSAAFRGLNVDALLIIQLFFSILCSKSWSFFACNCDTITTLFDNLLCRKQPSRYSRHTLPVLTCLV